MNEVLFLIFLTIFIAILFVIFSVLGVFDRGNKGIKLGIFSSAVALGVLLPSYFSKTYSLYNIGLGVVLILIASMYLYVPWNKIPYSNDFEKPLLITSIFAVIFGILAFISALHGIQSLIKSVQIVLIVATLLVGGYFMGSGLIYMIQNFGLVDWTIFAAILSSIFVASYKMIMHYNRTPFDKFKKVTPSYTERILKDPVGKWVVDLFSTGNVFETKVLIAEGALLLIYFIAYPILHSFIKSKFNNQNGRELTNYKHSLMNREIIASATDLNKAGEGAPGYNYAISFWTYISSDQQLSDVTETIFSYGTNPIVKYSAIDNKIIFCANKGNTVVTVREKKDVELQKWNNIIFNYVNGTMDIFYNGELLVSKVTVVPYIHDDVVTIGTSDILRGYISNVLYFKKTLDVNQIKKLYNLNAP